MDKLKHYKIHHYGLTYCVDVYAANKREAAKQYREQWLLTGRHIRLTIWSA